jgi:hypothetical protein
MKNRSEKTKILFQWFIILKTIVKTIILNEYKIFITVYLPNILPLTCKKLPLTDLYINYFLNLFLELKILYICKKFRSNIFMCKVKSFILPVLFIFASIAMVDSSLANCNNIANNKYMESISFINKSIISINSQKVEKNLQISLNSIPEDDNLNKISEGNSIEKPFIELNYTFSSFLSELRENDLKNKLGFQLNGFISLNKLCLKAYTSVIIPDWNMKDFIVTDDNTILFRQIQI